ncbi:MAG: tRNA (adenosine(37)-N6)-threonylcarbamoyltransferase complex transferase subunit TsaD, partial [Patescibacteria group bacterium]|nr:tRNA (adenosine(37)-N6)-threonylcarbamoyltransferase complex transferase subunit TsaD [Patescibacteria group bacterium]
MNILALETSFDETALAIVEDGRHLRYDVLSSSSSLHKRFGGVLPELAARKQLEYILPMLSETLSHHPLETIDAIAVTTGPGLIGSLLIGVETAKTIAFVTQKPIIPVNHIHAHPYANIIQPQDHIPTKNHIMFPAIALVASGGHTELFCMDHISSLRWIGGTIDDAAGESFDKTARLLGFEHKGGIAIEEAA